MKASDSAAIVIFIGMLGSVLGLIALVSPKLLRLPSRWFAVPLITLIIGATGLGILIDPTDPNGQSSPQSMREGGALLLGFWLMISGVAIAISRSANVTGVSLKLPSLKVTPPPPQKYKAFDLGISAKGATAKVQQAGEGIATAWREAKEREAARAADKRRIEDLARQLQEQRRVNEALVRSTTPPAKAARKAKPAIDYDQKRPPVDHGRSVSISYADADGVVTEREVLNWSIEDRHLVGYCSLRKQVRTFRLDRVLEWHDWIEA